MNCGVFTRNSSARGIGIGLFCAFLPMPFEMLPAIFMAIMLRGNLPFSIAGVWISNPITWIPLYTPCYLLGSMLINIEPVALESISLLSFGWHYVALWLGCLIVGTCLALTAHSTITFLWSRQIRERWTIRRAKRAAKQRKSNE